MYPSGGHCLLIWYFLLQVHIQNTGMLQFFFSPWKLWKWKFYSHISSLKTLAVVSFWYFSLFQNFIAKRHFSIWWNEYNCIEFLTRWIKGFCWIEHIVFNATIPGRTFHAQVLHFIVRKSCPAQFERSVRKRYWYQDSPLTLI